jgi:hypothetical protein
MANALTDAHIGWAVRVVSSPVVADIVGGERYQFDIWGDTLNVAARSSWRVQPRRRRCLVCPGAGRPGQVGWHIGSTGTQGRKIESVASNPHRFQLTLGRPEKVTSSMLR